MDLSYQVPPAVAAAATRLEQLMDEADEFCAAEKMMALERSPTVKRFGLWCPSEFVVQLGGGAPTPWDGPLDP